MRALMENEAFDDKDHDNLTSSMEQCDFLVD